MKWAIVLLFCVNLYGQSTLLKNVNYNARELKEHLNATKDSIVLDSDFTIFRVEMMNSKFFKSFEFSSKHVEVDISFLPLGRYTITVFTNRKQIALTLLREAPYEKPKMIIDTIYKDRTIDKHVLVVMREKLRIIYDTIWLEPEKIEKIIVKEIPYDLSTRDNDYKIIKQTREDYRNTHLRPNGKPYNNNF